MTGRNSPSKKRQSVPRKATERPQARQQHNRNESAREQSSTQSGSVWSRIEQQIAQDIARGLIAPGSRLPAEHALAERFEVNRHTVRQALASLASKGLVRITHGSGTYVADFAVDLVLGKRTRHSQNLATAGLTGALRLLHSSTVKAGALQAKWLQVSAGTELLCLITVGDARGRPITFSQRFFPAKRFAQMAEMMQTSGSITRAFAAHGVADYTRLESHVTAQLPPPEAAQQLGQPTSRPVLYVESVNVDLQGRPIEFACTYFAGDRVKLVIPSDG